MQTWEIVAIVSLFFSLPVLLSAYYQLFLFISSLRYPHNLEKELPELYSYPSVSILIAVFNEKNVIEKSLMAISKLDYPPEKLQVVVADDSIDDTVGIIDRVVYNLNVLGIKADISRRRSRENFKSGALNKAMELVTGEYVLLLDADSTVQPEIIKKGIHAIQTHEGTSFVSFRVGHYNRYSNFITRLFALSQDLGDTVSKMGSYRVNMPYSFQGGFTLLRTQTVRDVGLWSTNTITEDADLSWKLYLAGTRGIYLSNVRIMSEDPSTLETWKKQTARVQQGWSKLETDYLNVWPLLLLPVLMEIYIDRHSTKIAVKKPEMNAHGKNHFLYKNIRAVATLLLTVAIVASAASSGVYLSEKQPATTQFTITSIVNYTVHASGGKFISSMTVTVDYQPGEGNDQIIPGLFAIYTPSNSSSIFSGVLYPLLWSSDSNVTPGNNTITIRPDFNYDLIPSNTSFEIMEYYGYSFSYLRSTGLS